jgi:tetratricopeptide (TPR) repeat protein
LILTLMFFFVLASGGESVGPARSNLPWSELRSNAKAAEGSGDFKAAEQYYLQAVQTAADGGNPFDQFVVAEELGQLYWKRNNAPAALTYLRMAVTLLRHHSPADSELKGTALSNLGIVLGDTGSLSEAEETLSEALQIFQNLESHERISATYEALALYEICRGKYALAEEHVKQSLALMKEHGLENMTTARCLETLARVYATVGRIQEAKKIIAQAEAILRRNQPSSDADLIQCLDTKASLLFEQQRFSEAERLWRSIIEAAQRLVIVDPPYHLSELYVQTKQYGKAQELLEKLLQSQPDGNPSALSHALIEGQLAYALMEQHKDEQAEALFQSAVSTVAASPANESLEYALICLRYAKLKARHKDWQESVRYLDQGVKIENAVMPKSSAMVEALELSAQIYRKLSRHDDAKDCLNRANAMRATIETPRPSSTVDVEVLAAEMR